MWLQLIPALWSYRKMPLFTAAPQELTEPVLSILIYSTGAGGECSEGSHDLTAGDTQPTCSLAPT